MKTAKRIASEVRCCLKFLPVFRYQLRGDKQGEKSGMLKNIWVCETCGTWSAYADLLMQDACEGKERRHHERRK